MARDGSKMLGFWIFLGIVKIVWQLSLSLEVKIVWIVEIVWQLRAFKEIVKIVWIVKLFKIVWIVKKKE
jgi:hypothetical protein